MRIGLLRNRIKLQKLTQTLNEYNEPVESWSDYATVWAQVEDLRGREFLQARQIPAGEVSTRVRIRYRPDIDHLTMRVLYGTRALGIEAVIDPDGRKVMLELMCTEVDSGTATV